MPVSVAHDLKDTLDEVSWDLLVEEVAHRVDEDVAGVAPTQRNLERVGVQSEAEAGTAATRNAVMLVLGLAHVLETSGEIERIAMSATGRNAVATRDRIPSRLRPLDRATASHRLIFAVTLGSPCGLVVAGHERMFA